MTDPTDLEEEIKRLKRELKLGEQDNDRLARNVLELQRGTVGCFSRSAMAERTGACLSIVHTPARPTRPCCSLVAVRVAAAAWRTCADPAESRLPI